MYILSNKYWKHLSLYNMQNCEYWYIWKWKFLFGIVLTNSEPSYIIEKKLFYFVDGCQF